MTGAGAAGAGRAACVVGIDVGGTTLKGGVCDRDAAIVHGERRLTARDDADALVDGIVALAGGASWYQTWKLAAPCVVSVVGWPA